MIWTRRFQSSLSTSCLRITTPEDITGSDGILKQLTKAINERALATELTYELGYDKHSQSPGMPSVPQESWIQLVDMLDYKEGTSCGHYARSRSNQPHPAIKITPIEVANCADNLERFHS